jgi:dipeptidyl aminopeptidase/acylaminoacyl peptidase
VQRSSLLTLLFLALSPWARQAPAQDQPAPAQMERNRELLKLRSYGGAYHTATFSPDGRHIAAASARDQVAIWDANSGQQLMVFTGHRNEVIDVAFSPDGKWLASSGREGARVWNRGTGNESFAILNKGWLSRVGFSPDSRYVAALGSGIMVIWDVVNGQEMRVVRTNAGTETSVVFRPDGRLLATASTDRTIRLWDAPNGQERMVLREHTSPVHCLAFSPDGKYLASASLDKTVRLYDAATGQVLLRIVAHPTGVHAVGFSPDGRRLVTGGVDRTVKIRELRTGTELLTLTGHTGPVYSVAFHRDGRRVVSTASDGTVRVWDLGMAPEPPVTLLSCELEALWEDLAADRTLVAFQAASTLVAAPEQTVAFMKSRLKPAAVGPEEAERLRRLIDNLDAQHFAVRQKATDELEKLGRLAEPALRLVLEDHPTLEVLQRVERLRTRLQSAPPSLEQLFAERAVEVLEQIGTKEARVLLESLGRGSPESWLTREAKEALQRLGRGRGVRFRDVRSGQRGKNRAGGGV